jgi:hypothetical protein
VTRLRRSVPAMSIAGLVVLCIYLLATLTNLAARNGELLAETRQRDRELTALRDEIAALRDDLGRYVAQLEAAGIKPEVRADDPPATTSTTQPRATSTTVRRTSTTTTQRPATTTTTQRPTTTTTTQAAPPPTTTTTRLLPCLPIAGCTQGRRR